MKRRFAISVISMFIIFSCKNAPPSQKENNNIDAVKIIRTQNKKTTNEVKVEELLFIEPESRDGRKNKYNNCSVGGRDNQYFLNHAHRSYKIEDDLDYGNGELQLFLFRNNNNLVILIGLIDYSESVYFVYYLNGRYFSRLGSIVVAQAENVDSQEISFRVYKANDTIFNIHSFRDEEEYSITQFVQTPLKVDDIDVGRLIYKDVEFHGMIGDDIQNMRIVFTAIRRINEREYEVIGKSKVKDNICDFKGTMEAKNVETYDIIDEDDDLSTIDGQIRGHYIFSEDKTQSGAGIFEGWFKVYWAYYYDGIGLADLWYTSSDDLIHFDGTWKSNRTEKIKNVCWGDYNACFPADFDISDGPDLIVSEKYRSSGWGYMIDFYSQDEEKRQKAIAEYEKQWWK